MIVTAKTPTISLTKGGTTTQATCTINLSGDTTFENLTLKIVSTSSYNNFNANGHNVTMGEGLTCVAGSKSKYFMLGAGTFSSAAVPSTDLAVKSGTWEYIYAGGYTGGVTGDANLSISNATVKTAVMNSYNGTTSGNVNITISNSTIPALYGGNANKNNVGGNITITLGKGASIPTIYAGSRDSGNVDGTVTLVIDGADVSSTIYGKCKTSGTIGGFELLLKDGSLNTVPTNVQKVTVDTTAGGKISYPAEMGDYDAVTAAVDGAKLVSLDTATLRVENYDVASYGETDLKATVFVTLADGTVIETAQQSTTLRALVEAINEKASFTAEQLSALKAMIEKHEVMQTWDISNITA